MMNKIIKSPEIRRYLYLIGAAIAALLVGYNIITVEQSGLWLNFLVAILGVQSIMAAVNTPEKPSDEQEEEITTIFDVED